VTHTSSRGMGTLKEREHSSAGQQPFYKSNDFWRSFVNVFSSWNTFDPFYYRRDPWKADYDALSGDWEAIGLDLTRAMRRFELEYKNELEDARQQRLFDPDKNV
jgi:hypothetical protein